MVLGEQILCWNKEVPISKLFLNTILFSCSFFPLSHSICPPSPWLYPFHTTGSTQEDCDCTAVRKMKTIRVPWIVPLSPVLLLLVGHGNLTNNTTERRDGEGHSTEEDRKPCPQGGEKWRAKRKLWSSCGGCGMKGWTIATQLNCCAKQKTPLCTNGRADRQTDTHTHTQLQIAFRYGHCRAFSGCNQ